MSDSSINAGKAISPSEDLREFAHYDPEAVIEALERTAGSWSDLDADQIIADLYRAREEGSRQAQADDGETRD